ncbi:MAG: hypothetical protein LAO76_23630 [Acidobacteriia bacterium]|nr:hypothetical protein [Terriglobia bacterium]
MKLRLGIPLLLLLSFAAGKDKIEPDSINISNGIVESPYFKFHYEFPKGWALKDDALRMQQNRKSHEEGEKNAQAKAKADAQAKPGTTVLSAHALWMYNLFVAAPDAVPAQDYPPLPYVHIWALERNGIQDKPGDNAKLLTQIGTMKALRPLQEQMIGGRKFIRADMAGGKEKAYVSMFDTASRGYLLFFEFRANDERQMNDLAKTMESLKFD